MKKKEVVYINENGNQVTEKLMVMCTEEGCVTIEEADFSAMYRNVEEIYHWAKQGKEIYEDWSKVFDCENPIEDIILINRQANTLSASIDALKSKYNIHQSAAEALVNMSLSELTGLDIEEIQEKLKYYSLAEHQLKTLIDFRSH